MEKIKIARYDSPVGELVLGSFNRKLCICDWVLSSHRTATDLHICRCLNAAYEEDKSEFIQHTISQLDEYFTGRRTQFSIPIQLAGSDFQCRVWSELMKIPYGVTISYSELARRIENPKAVRAVASAVAANVMSIIVPCHRVIGSNNSLTGYRGGLEAKQELLALEARTGSLHQNQVAAGLPTQAPCLELPLLQTCESDSNPL